MPLDAYLRAHAVDAEDGEAQRQEQVRQAEREERLETSFLAQRQAGVRPGDLLNRQLAVSETRERILDLREQLARAEGQLAREQSGLQEVAQRMQMASDMVTRSAGPAGLGDAPAHVAEARRAAANARVDQMLAAASARGRAREPVAVRSEPSAGGVITRGIQTGFRFVR